MTARVLPAVLLACATAAWAQDGPFKDSGDAPAASGKAVPAASAGLGVPASEAYRAEVLGKARARLLSAAKVSDDKPCGALAAELAFIKDKTGQAVDEARFTRELDAALADTEVLFIKNSVRDGWNGKDSPVAISPAAKAAGLTAGVKQKLEGRCKCRLGSPGKPAMIVFNNTGDEGGFETSPPSKLSSTAPHEMLHIVLPRFGGELAGPRAAALHHGLTAYLGLTGGASGNMVPYHPSCVP